MDEILLARIFAHQGTIVKCQIRVEGMKAENIERESCGMAMAWPASCFDDVAVEVENAVSELKSIGDII